jgi:hypothetical protein
MPDSFDVRNYRQFQRALGDITTALPKDLKDAAKQIAEDWISAARNKATRPNAKAAAQAMTVGYDTQGATINNRHPLFYGEEFGGQARPETMQFPPHQGQRGYWLFPAARDNADKFQKVWEAAIDKATQPWDNKGG